MAMLNKLTYPNKEVCICDNSDNLLYYSHLLNTYKEFSFLRVNPKNKTIAQTICESYNKLVEFAIKKECHYIMVIESDIFPPFNIIERLINANVQVISAMYHVGIGSKSSLLLQRVHEDMLVTSANGSLILKVDSLIDGDDILFVDGSIKEIFACGLGCTLIHASIFANIPFRYSNEDNYFNDTFFYIDLFQRGIKNFVHTGIVCEHRNIQWDKQEALKINK